MAICTDSLDLGYSCTSPCRVPLARGRSPGRLRQDSKPAADDSDFPNHKTINTALGPLGFGIAKDLFFQAACGGIDGCVSGPNRL